MIYYFEIEYNADAPYSSRVYPLFDDVKIDYKRQDGQVFFRKECSSSFRFVNNDITNDYTFLKRLENYVCEEITFKIRRNCDDEIVFQGYCNYYDFRIDENECFIETRFSPDDEYRCFLENGDVEHNFIPSLPNNTVTSDTDFQFERQICVETKKAVGVRSGGCFLMTEDGTGKPASNALALCPEILPSPDPTVEGWYFFDSSYRIIDYTSVTAEIITTWIREIKITFDIGGNPQTPAGSGWIQDVATTKNGLPATKWVRVPFNGAYTTATKYLSYGLWDYYTGSFPALYDVPLFFTIIGGPCYHYYRLDLPEQIQEYTQFKNLGNVIDFLIGETCTGFIYNSRFLDDAINPVTLVNNPLQNLMIAQKSDIVDPDAVEKATKGELSFLRMMEILRDMFQAYWWIDGNQVRIEHISYWVGDIAGYNANPGTGVDLTILDDGINIEGMNKYRFSKDKMPNRETFEWMEAGNDDFVGKDIIYSNVCTYNRNEEYKKEYQLLEITTDIWFIQNNPTDVSNDGFVIIVDGSLQSTGVYAANGVISGAFISNAPLSWANLHNLYWRYDRVIIPGNMNGVDVNFLTSLKIKIQDPLSFQLCCEDFDPNDYVKTDIGDGEIISSELDLVTNDMKINLKY